MEKTIDLTESSVLDPEFTKWLKISDEIQGYGDKISEEMNQLTEIGNVTSQLPGQQPMNTQQIQQSQSLLKLRQILKNPQYMNTLNTIGAANKEVNDIVALLKNI